MQSSNEMSFQQLPTSILQKRFYDEWDRVANILMRVYPAPLSNESLKVVLEELLALNDELERRQEPLDSYSHNMRAEWQKVFIALKHFD